jgi:hypothetical protein
LLFKNLDILFTFLNFLSSSTMSFKKTDFEDLSLLEDLVLTEEPLLLEDLMLTEEPLLLEDLVLTEEPLLLEDLVLTELFLFVKIFLLIFA